MDKREEDLMERANHLYADCAADGNSSGAATVKTMQAELTRLQSEIAALREALAGAEAAISGYYRYFTGGEMRGSYDGKPEREAMWKAQRQARAALAAGGK